MGHSAGGIAVNFYGDFIKEHYFKNKIIDITLLNDGGYLNEYNESNAGTRALSDFIQYNKNFIWKSISLTSAVDDVEKINGNFISNIVQNNIQTPMFVIQDQLDSEFLGNIPMKWNQGLLSKSWIDSSGISSDWAGPFVLSAYPCTRTGLVNESKIQFIGDYLLNNKLGSQFNSISPISGKHTFTTFGTQWNSDNYKIPIDGLDYSIQGAFSKWFFDKTINLKWIENVSDLGIFLGGENGACSNPTKYNLMREP